MRRTKKDFIVQHFRAGGKGGQNQNKTNSGVRIIDKITGLSSEGREFRSQEQNKEAAFLRLVDKMIAYYKKQATSPVFIEAQENGRGGSYRRTYKPMASVVIDHVTEKKYPYQDIIDGGLDRIHKDMGL